jgi:hypothetical protein
MWFLKHNELSFNSFEESGIYPDKAVSVLITIHRQIIDTGSDSDDSDDKSDSDDANDSE